MNLMPSYQEDEDVPYKNVSPDHSNYHWQLRTHEFFIGKGSHVSFSFAGVNQTAE